MDWMLLSTSKVSRSETSGIIASGFIALRRIWGSPGRVPSKGRRSALGQKGDQRLESIFAENWSVPINLEIW